ncbi:hypothetical protein CVT25_011362 [Psilocybe cyanescens]|uniref:ABM domain-containing protein n=1 Tax=Psilocybe cyanescens TaxID=93625 RepID=A0A409WG63_PSICY|nr:hypothetical protein CVT25_011362 [Psilocybe cyanescens]
MSSTQFVEHVSFVASEAFLADNALFDQLKAWLDKNGEGVFLGFDVQDPTHAHAFVLWQSFEHLINASQHPDFLPGFMTPFSALVASGLTVLHIDFDGNPTTAFSAPVTELSVVTPKEGHTQEEVNAIITQFKESAAAVPGVHTPLVWGNIRKTVEYALAAGWDSVEAHLNAVTVPPVDALAGRLFGISDVVVKHITLKKV